jgi:hypothetical protein
MSWGSFVSVSMGSSVVLFAGVGYITECGLEACAVDVVDQKWYRFAVR